MLDELLKDAQHQLEVCNACRYCEGYCAVFPALERRTSFDRDAVAYIANLCHDCRDCYYACPYAPPHEFGIDIPRVLSDVRVATYTEATPVSALRAAGNVARQDLGLTILGGLLVLVVTLLVSGSAMFAPQSGPGAFYRVIPWALMVVPGLLLGLWVAVSLAIGGLRFYRATGATPEKWVDVRAIVGATWEALTLRWLGGGGDGCRYPTSRVSNARVYLHTLVFGGFALTFLSTIIAAFEQDILDRLPPYPIVSAPVITGSVGGLAMIVGCGGLLVLKAKADRRTGSEEMRGLDVAFLVNLGLASLTGMLLLAFRDTSVMGILLVSHFATLATLYITAPYTKFAHFVYRYAALVRNRIETHREQVEPETAAHGDIGPGERSASARV